MAASQLDEACERGGGVVSFDLPSVEVELREQQSCDRALHAFAAAAVERLWICEQIERQGEELSAAGELAGGVSRLLFNGLALPCDRRQLDLELVAGPVRVVEQFEVAVFLGVKLPETDVQALAKIGSRLQLVRHRLVDLAA